MTDGLEASRRQARRNVVLTLIFCRKYVPETKGKRLEDIQEYFRKKIGAASSAPTA
jgi:hypothetical protein